MSKTTNTAGKAASPSLSAKLGGQEGISRDKYAETLLLLDILVLFASKIPSFWDKYVLRGGFALYHTSYSQQHLAGQSDIRNILRWTADMDLEALSELTEEDRDIIRQTLLDAGYTVVSEHHGNQSYAQHYELMIESVEGMRVEIDVLDCHRTSSLLNDKHTIDIIETEIIWDEQTRIPVRTQSIEEIVARKLLINYYHTFRPQDALDLFYALGFMLLDKTKLRCAFTSSLALWAGEDDLKALCQYQQKPDALVDRLVQITHKALIDRILQRVTLFGLEVLFDNRFHIIDRCERTIKHELIELLTFNENEQRFLLDMLHLRQQLVRFMHYDKQKVALPPSLLVNLSCELGEFPSSAEVNNIVKKKTGEFVHTLQENDDAYSHLNAAYVGRCLELYIQRQA